ncbi:MAG TPA: site-specific integrase [Propionibacteriaceae bacterium]|nr:site-specific integrase [Propionibacteriaceae bacterium]
MTSKRYFGSIRQRESGRWQIRYRTRDGQRVSHPVTYARRADAARMLAELERQAQTGGPLIDTRGSRIAFKDYALRWIDQHPGLRPRTVEVYRSQLNRHLLPLLGEVPLRRIDTAMVREWRARLSSQGVSRTMVAKSYRLLRAILNTAVVEDELIASNPCKIKGAGEERADERPALNLDQVYELVGLVPERWRAFMLLKTFASLRWGEITALTREDVDLDKRTVRVRRQFVTVPGGLQVGPPKSRAGIRIVSFPAAILPELRRHLRDFAADGPAGLVFPNEHGQPLRRGNFNKAVGWVAIRDQLGVPGLHLHDLRHTGNTLAAQSGASLRDLMTRMGHDSPAAALIYQHSSRASDEAIAAALDAQLSARLQAAENELRDGLGAQVGPESERAHRAETR